MGQDLPESYTNLVVDFRVHIVALLARAHERLLQYTSNQRLATSINIQSPYRHAVKHKHQHSLVPSHHISPIMFHAKTCRTYTYSSLINRFEHLGNFATESDTVYTTYTVRGTWLKTKKYDGTYCKYANYCTPRSYSFFLNAFKH